MRLWRLNLPNRTCLGCIPKRIYDETISAAPQCVRRHRHVDGNTPLGKDVGLVVSWSAEHWHSTLLFLQSSQNLQQHPLG